MDHSTSTLNISEFISLNIEQAKLLARQKGQNPGNFRVSWAGGNQYKLLCSMHDQRGSCIDNPIILPITLVSGESIVTLQRSLLTALV